MFEAFHLRSIVEQKGVLVGDIEYLWYVTTVDMLPIIFREGISANNTSLQFLPELPQRAKVKVPDVNPEYSPRPLASYVGLYLRPDNATMYAKINQWRKAQPGANVTQQLCALRIDRSVLRTSGAVLTSRNPLAHDVKFFFPNDDTTEIYPFPACQSLALPTLYAQTEESYTRQAEALIPQYIAPSCIESIFVADTAKLEYVKGVMHGAGADKPIEHYPKLFFGADKRVRLYEPHYYLAAYPDTLRKIIEQGANSVTQPLTLYPTAQQAFANSKYILRTNEICANQTFILAVYIPRNRA